MCSLPVGFWGHGAYPVLWIRVFWSCFLLGKVDTGFLSGFGYFFEGWIQIRLSLTVGSGSVFSLRIESRSTPNGSAPLSCLVTVSTNVFVFLQQLLDVKLLLLYFFFYVLFLLYNCYDLYNVKQLVFEGMKYNNRFLFFCHYNQNKHILSPYIWL